MSGTFSDYAIIFDDKSHPEDEKWETAPTHYFSRPKKRTTYHNDQVRQVQMLYITAAILWIILIFLAEFYKTDIIGLIILSIPLIVYAINYFNICDVTQEVEQEMFHGNFLSFAFLIAIILINWTKIEDKGKFFRVLMLALFLITLSLVDIWLNPRRMAISRHFRTILQTAALVLLVFVLYMYYTDVINKPQSPNKDFTEYFTGFTTKNNTF